jgi:hypothetical protein
MTRTGVWGAFVSARYPRCDAVLIVRHRIVSLERVEIKGGLCRQFFSSTITPAIRTRLDEAVASPMFVLRHLLILLSAPRAHWRKASRLPKVQGNSFRQ